MRPSVKLNIVFPPFHSFSATHCALAFDQAHICGYLYGAVQTVTENDSDPRRFSGVLLRELSWDDVRLPEFEFELELESAGPAPVWIWIWCTLPQESNSFLSLPLFSLYPPSQSRRLLNYGSGQFAPKAPPSRFIFI